MKKIMFCGGGSAGHVMPNIALIEDLKQSFEVCYCGTGGIEKNICKEHGVKFFEYDAVKFVRGKILCNLKIPFKLFNSVNSAKNILKEQMPDLLFCKGGYVCLPAAMAAKKLNIPVITHESDISPGLANKIIARYCKSVLCTFPTTALNFKRGVYVGSPMRKALFNKSRSEALAYFGLKNRPTILVFGGGSGSKIINDCVRKAAFELCKTYNILHLCGKGNLVESKIDGYKQVEFINDMGLAYACADIAVARCGSNSACEITALKIPALFIPLENKRSRGDQVKNAEYFAALGVCRILREKELTEKSLVNNIEMTVKDDKIKNAFAKINYESGNDKIKKIIFTVLK